MPREERKVGTVAERLAEDLWRLEIPLVGNPLKTLNSYLITGERSLLIDTGFRQDPCRAAMERELSEVGVDRDRMDIFLTHLHSDHTGLAPELIRPGCRIYMGRSDGRRMLEGLRPDFWKRTYTGFVTEGFSPEEMEALWDTNPARTAAPVPYEDYVFLEDGDTLPVEGRALRCILTPGHTPGHLCLWDEAAGRLFSGDHVLFHITPNICRWEGVEDSLGDYLQSLTKIAPLPVRELLPAHRRDRGELAARIAELKAHHARRLADAIHTVKDHPGLTAYEIAGRMAWSIRCRSWADFPLTQKYFAVGEALAHLDHLRRLGQAERRVTAGLARYYPAERA